MKKVSIIMTYYKKKDFFEESFYSAVNQSYANKEIILVFDDDNKEELENLKKVVNFQKDLIFIDNKKTEGVALSRNKAMKISTGEYLAFLDCDDIWEKDKLKVQIDFMEKNNIDFSYTNYYLINETNKKIGKMLAKKELTYKDLISSCDIGLSTVIMHKKLLNFGSFPNLKTKEDYAFWLKLSKNSIKFYGLNENLALWRKSKHSLSRSIFQGLSDAYKVFYLYENNNFFLSIFRTLILSLNVLKKKIIQKINLLIEKN